MKPCGKHREDHWRNHERNFGESILKKNWDNSETISRSNLGRKLGKFQGRTLKTSTRNPAKNLKTSPEEIQISLEEIPGASVEMPPKYREKLLESLPGKPLTEIPKEIVDTFWKDLCSEFSEKLRNHMGKTSGRNPVSTSAETP